MSLLKDSSTWNYVGDNSYDEANHSLEMISTVERRISQKKQAVEDLENELFLLKKQALDIYKSRVSYFPFELEILKSAAKWLVMNKNNKDSDGNKLDRRKRYEEKNCYEFIFEKTKNLLGVDDLDITEIIDFDFSSAMEIEFTSHNHNWTLKVPMVKNIRSNHYDRYGAWCFKLCLFHNEGCGSTQVGATYEEDEIKDIMQRGIEMYCKEK